MAWPGSTLLTDSSGWDIPGASYTRKGVYTLSDKKLRHEFVDSMVFSPLIGDEKSNAPIIHVRQAKKEKGDTIRLHMLPRLTGVGKAGDIEMYGNEEVLDFSYVDLYINQLRHAVVDEGKMSSQRGIFDIVENARPALTRWLTDKIEDSIVRTVYYGWPPHLMGTAATYGGIGANASVVRPPRHWFCADEANNTTTYSAVDGTYADNVAVGEALLTNVASDFMSPAILEGLRTKMTILNIPPAVARGWEGYVIVLHPNQVNQLRQNTTWFNAQINATPRDAKSNPVFAGVKKGLVGFWNNFIILESNKIGNSAQAALMGETISDINATASSSVYRAIAMGAGALGYAEGGEFGTPHFESEQRDINNRTAVSLSTIFGLGRTDYVEDTSSATLVAQNVAVISTYSPAAVV